MKELYLMITIILFSMLIMNCGKQAVREEQVSESQVVQQGEQLPDTTIKEAETLPTKVETTMVETTAVVPSYPTEAETSKIQEKEGKLEEVLEVITPGDSIDVMYMVRPNDYLIKIAKNEYGVAWMWRQIYKWNIDKIGDNPDLIYPFNEFLLKKPKDKANPVEYDFYDYVVKSGESLWSIAEKEYGNNYAWIVILHDNADKLDFDLRKLQPGTVLKLRTKLW